MSTFDRNLESLESWYENTKFNPDSPDRLTGRVGAAISTAWIPWRKSVATRDFNRDFYLIPAPHGRYPRLPVTTLLVRCVERNAEEEREDREEPVPRFNDARILRGSFAREKERPHVIVARANLGTKYWFLTRLESSSFHGSFPRAANSRYWVLPLGFMSKAVLCLSAMEW